MKRRKREPFGFTLVEILVAVSVTLVALAAVPVTHRVTARMLAGARDGTAAVGLAQAKLEELMENPGGAPGRGHDTIVLGSSAFERRWTLDADRPGSPTCRIAVTVSWRGTHAVKLESAGWQP